MAVVDYLTSYIVTHMFRSTPSAKQTTDALDTICRQNGGFFSIIATDGGPQMTSNHFRQWADDKFIVHRLSSATAAWLNGRSERAIQDLRAMWDRAEMEKGGKLSVPERAHVLSIFNDSPRQSRRLGIASTPALQVGVMKKGCMKKQPLINY